MTNQYTSKEYHTPSLFNKFLIDEYKHRGNVPSHWRGTRIHNSFRALFHTNKGKKKEKPAEWEDFFVFMEEVQEGYEPHLYLCRQEQKLPYSKNNVEWVIRSKVASDSNKVYIKYKGELLTFSDIYNKYGVSVNTQKCRKRRGWSDDEIVEGKKIRKTLKKRPITCQKELEGQALRDKASKMISSYRTRDKRRGQVTSISIEFMVNNIFPLPCTYCGVGERIGCDRIDNNLPHIEGNLVPCCYECNLTRGDRYSFEEMKVLGEAIRGIKNERKDRLE